MLYRNCQLKSTAYGYITFSEKYLNKADAVLVMMRVCGCLGSTLDCKSSSHGLSPGPDTGR